MKKSMVLILSFLAFTLICLDSMAAPQKGKELPKSGSLASTGNYGFGKSQAGLPWGTDSGGINSDSPISGSITRKNTSEWTMKVFNNSKEAYSVDVQVLQFNNNGAKVKSDSYSYSLAPGKNASRAVAAGIGADRAELNLGRWKKAGSAMKKEQTEEAAPEEPASVEQVPDIE